jgi:hypothetical protein
MEEGTPFDEFFCKPGDESEYFNGSEQVRPSGVMLAVCLHSKLCIQEHVFIHNTKAGCVLCKLCVCC